MGAKMFGLKQKVMGFVGTVFTLVFLVLVGQIGHFLWKAKDKVPTTVEAAMNKKLPELNGDQSAAGRIAQAQLSFKQDLESLVKSQAGGYYRNQPPMIYTLVSTGQHRNIDENMVERYKLKYSYSMATKILWVYEFNKVFVAELEVPVKPGGALKYYVKAK